MPAAANPIMSSPVNTSPSQIQNWTVQYAQQYGVSSTTALQILQQESSGGTNTGTNTNTNNSYDTGPMQLNSNNFVGPNGTFAVTGGSGAGNYDPNDPQQNVQGGVAYLAQLQQMYTNNAYGIDPSTLAIAAYNNGPGNVNKALTSYGSDFNSHLPNPSYLTEVQAQTIPPVNQNGVAINQSAQTNPAVDPAPDVLTQAVVPYRNLAVDPVTDEAIQALQPPTRDNSLAQNGLGGLDQTPWYLNSNEVNAITGIRNSYNKNVATHKKGYPVTFEIITDRTSGARLSSNGKPVSIRLNASMTNYNLQSSHIVNKQNSRTGIHLTFWGMNADMISGECSTGAFFNQFGLTSFLNMSQISSEAQQFILAAYRNDPSILAKITGTSGSDQLRIAAQDAFVEFLSLFKNNGVTWFHPKDYTANNGNAPDQATLLNNQPETVNYQSAFSPSTTNGQTPTGLTSYQARARNNDVYTRGYIVMNFRSSSYLGYFKSLSWVADADNPFRWTFNFVFQIERTLTLLYYPYPGSNTQG